MKSVKKKAEEYGYSNWQSDEYHDGASKDLDFDPIGHTQKTFEAGANYVLDAIEKIFAENTNPISPDSHVLYCIKNTIEKLKKK